VSNAKGLLIELIQVGLLALVLYLGITFAIQTVHVEGPSMYPTLDAQGQDYLIALKLPYRFSAPQRGDIIITPDPSDPSTDLIKRIVGVPGDRIASRDGKIYINERLLSEPYTNHSEHPEDTWPASGQEVTLNSDQYFLMGDNRNHSRDSRMFGPVERDQILAQAWFRVLPFNRLGFVDNQHATLTTQRMPA
jgi:signal peptidase I